MFKPNTYGTTHNNNNNHDPYDIDNASRGGGNFELPPEGIHQAYIVGLCDKGMQERSYQNQPPKMKHVLQMFWGFSTRRSDGGWSHWTQGKEVPFTLAPNSGLTKIACAALGVPKITRETMPSIKALLGRSTTIEVVYSEREQNGFRNKRAVIKAVLRAGSDPVLDPRLWEFNRGSYDYYMRTFGNITVLPGLLVAPPEDKNSDDIPF